VIKSRKKSCAGHVARMGDWRGAYRVLVRRLDRKRPFGRPRSKWEDNIKIDLQEVRWEELSGLLWLGIGKDGGRL